MIQNIFYQSFSQEFSGYQREDKKYISSLNQYSKGQKVFLKLFLDSNLVTNFSFGDYV